MCFKRTRYLIPLVCLVMLLLAACGGGGQEQQSEQGGGAPQTEETGTGAEETGTGAEETGTGAEETGTGAEETGTGVEETGTGGEGMLPMVDPFEVSGDILVAGSSTVFPLTEAMAERFRDEGYEGQITIDSIGTGAGFERFCVSAEIDIVNASRAINEEEAGSCQEQGREPVEFRVGTDALAVVINPANDFVDGLTLDQLAQIFSGEATTWADVNPDWPAEEINLYSPGTDSGTFDYFVEAVFEGDQEPILRASNIQFSEDDNVLVQGIGGSPNGIGYFGYAYYEENAGQLSVVPIEGVEPTAGSVEANEYPLSRPLFIYSAPSIMQQKAQVAAFINYYLTFVNEEVEAVGYFPASQEALEEAQQAWLDAMEQE